MRDRKPNISVLFIAQSDFALPKNIRWNSKYDFILKILNKQELQQIAFNHWLHIDFKNVINLYETFFAKPYSFLDIDFTLAEKILHVSERIFWKEYKN